MKYDKQRKFLKTTETKRINVSIKKIKHWVFLVVFILWIVVFFLSGMFHSFITFKLFNKFKSFEDAVATNFSAYWLWYFALAVLVSLLLLGHVLWEKIKNLIFGSKEQKLWLFNQKDRTGNWFQFKKRFIKNDKTKANWVLSANRANSYFYDKDQNALIIGGSGSGKTQKIIIPSIVENANLINKPNMVVIDLKGEILSFCGDTLQNNGYKIISINLDNTKFSEKWNPLSLIYNTFEKKPKLALQMINDIVENLNFSGNDNNSNVWEQQAKQLVRVILQIMLLASHSSKEELSRWKYLFNQKTFNMANVNKYISYESFTGRKLHDMMEAMQYNPLWMDLFVQYQSLSSVPSETFAGYAMNASKAIQHFINNDNIKTITSTTDGLDLEELINSKQQFALFLKVPDHKTSTHILMPLLIDQIYELAIEKANNMPNGALDRTLQFYLDEFGNTPKINNFDNKISICRQRNVFFMLVLQDTEQLNKYNSSYGSKQGSIIKANCGLQYFISSNNQATLKEVSESLGKRKISKFSKSKSSSNNSSNITESDAEEDVMSVNALKQKSLDYIIVQLIGELPLMLKAQMAYKIYNIPKYTLTSSNEKLEVDLPKNNIPVVDNETTEQAKQEDIAEKIEDKKEVVNTKNTQQNTTSKGNNKVSIMEELLKRTKSAKGGANEKK